MDHLTTFTEKILHDPNSWHKEIAEVYFSDFADTLFPNWCLLVFIINTLL
jgi:hypothetical protein